MAASLAYHFAHNKTGFYGPDAVCIKFDYGDGTNSLGGTMPRAHAEALVAKIHAAASVGMPMPVTEPAVPAAATPSLSNIMAPPVPAPPVPPLASASALALIAANLAPLAGVLFSKWGIGEVMVLFWAESAVIGFYTVLKLAIDLRAHRREHAAKTPESLPD